ncbi:LppP/LprE family lipoprotein [Rhodococcus sp. G-MC3]|uniref:LppP/LprE family lipoprotein n=1 Tax=Rhodococcus sp. G-MC3 TaxID=3046209 RepID=UPI0024BA5FE1|nr:LppP/LprE family lipoprotein [Rhodococcus sp. G-MC3]MDJ0392592.1 LppP/LprE family lipoprotein [Rhodococcus sp. G-MC3]
MKKLLLVAISVMALVACGNSEDGDATAVAESSAAPGRQSVTQTPELSIPALPPVVSGAPVPAPGLLPTADAGSPQAAPAQPAQCISMGSPVVTNALATIPAYFDGTPWVAYDMGDPCALFTWVSATAPMATSSTPDHHLFFADGVYLGTATLEPYSFSSVSGQTADTITIGYRWLVGDEAFADPQGGPASIRYEWDGSTVTMRDTLPTEVTG